MWKAVSAMLVFVAYLATMLLDFMLIVRKLA